MLDDAGAGLTSKLRLQVNHRLASEPDGISIRIAAIVLPLTAQVDRLLPLLLGAVESDGAEPRVEGNARIDSHTAAEACAQDSQLI